MKKLVAGNWKMNMDADSSVKLAEGIALKSQEVAGAKVDIMLCPPFVYLPAVINAVRTEHIAVGAQNVYFESNGAFTGEISIEMLKDIGCTYVLCGHSERRHVIGETDELINKKVSVALSGGILPVLCVGETKDQREAEQTADVVTTQLKGGLAGFNAEKASAVTIAYEPVWAIGTGLTATREQAQEVHALIRGLLGEMYDKDLASEIRILYGGSVKPGNAAELMSEKDIDGVLVGGASLKVDDFIAIIEAGAQD
ncbi:MAG: triose-phosphate isomerase [Planctomycetota bacterium]|jgi:triosephosphate isomerase